MTVYNYELSIDDISLFYDSKHEKFISFNKNNNTISKMFTDGLVVNGEIYKIVDYNVDSDLNKKLTTFNFDIVRCICPKINVYYYGYENSKSFKMIVSFYNTKDFSKLKLML